MFSFIPSAMTFLQHVACVSGAPALVRAWTPSLITRALYDDTLWYTFSRGKVHWLASEPSPFRPEVKCACRKIVLRLKEGKERKETERSLYDKEKEGYRE